VTVESVHMKSSNRWQPDVFNPTAGYRIEDKCQVKIGVNILRIFYNTVEPAKWAEIGQFSFDPKCRVEV
jgi:hypothetical protein